MRPLYHQHTREQGSALVTLLVIIGIIVIIFSAIEINLSNSIKLQAKVDYETNVLAIRKYVESRFSCPLTQAHIALPCEIGTQVEGWGFNEQGKPEAFFSASTSTPTIVYGFQVRIRCEACNSCSGGRQLIFEGYKPGRDALSGFQRNWVNLFQQGELTCDVGI